MSDSATKKMLRKFEQTITPSMALSGMFQSPAENFYNSETVEIDIEREDEDIAIAVQDLSAGYRNNSWDDYTNKKFKPPVFKEKFALNSWKLLKRQAGDHPFEDPAYVASALQQFTKYMGRLSKKVKRTLELQAAQILQTGIVDLVDGTGATIYSIDFKAKASHIINASNPWDGGAQTICADLEGLAEEIRNDSLNDVVRTFWGIDAWNAALADTNGFVKKFDVRDIKQGLIGTMPTGGTRGLNFRGVLDLGNYKIEIWTYGARYVHPSTGVKTQYLDPKKVIMMTDNPRFDATFGAIPQAVEPDPRMNRWLSRVRGINQGMDLNPIAWATPDGTQLFGAVRARPLLIPTQIDAFGCIDSLVS